ncbi:MAG: hypothetical protein JXR70_02100 [Spirochaetales bacterium]|nr:hypothetical protein [Spirochaetales bacterium]
MRLYPILLVLMVSLLFAGCFLNPDPDSPTGLITNEERVPDYQVYTVNSSSLEPFNYTLTMSDPRDVYFVFTNSTITNLVLPVVTDLSKGAKSESMSGSNMEALQKTSSKSSNLIHSGPEIIKGSPWVTEWNKYLRQNPLPLGSKSGTGKSGGGTQPRFDVIGESGQKLYDSEGNYLEATCRLIRKAETAFGTKTLNIWVADNCWENGGDRAYNITQDMVEVLADKFLNNNGMDDDIYDWVTNLYGEEWSSYNYADVIPESDEITIFLYDISADNSTTGGYIGMFHSKDNFIKDYYYNNPYDGYIEENDGTRFSNERIMFYLDAVLFATPQNGSWHPSDHLPQETFSALAHEFQHMINFHIKTIGKGVYTEIWLNEMMSLCTEDILADKIGVMGPRGVDSNTPGAGPEDIRGGRLPLHIVYPDFPLLYWPTPDEGKIINWAAYSNKYAFGAYLMRNYKPATFLKRLMDSPYSDYRALEDAIPGYETIGQLYAKSGVANIISDLKTNLSDDQGYAFNTGSWISESFGAANINYRLGSINMYNYQYVDIEMNMDLHGPFFYTTSPVGNEDYSVFLPMTNFFYKVGEGLSGKIARQITMQPGTIMTVVVKK